MTITSTQMTANELITIIHNHPYNSDLVSMPSYKGVSKANLIDIIHQLDINQANYEAEQAAQQAPAEEEEIIGISDEDPRWYTGSQVEAEPTAEAEAEADTEEAAPKTMKQVRSKVRAAQGKGLSELTIGIYTFDIANGSREEIYANIKKVFNL